jgi:DNA-directed RNA polymerase subunit RPC12/RpoP
VITETLHHTCQGCGNTITIVFSGQPNGATFRYDVARCSVCPRCGQRLLATVRPVRTSHQGALDPWECNDTTPALSYQATLRAVQGLLRLALQHVEKVLRDTDQG